MGNNMQQAVQPYVRMGAKIWNQPRLAVWEESCSFWEPLMGEAAHRKKLEAPFPQISK